MFFDIGIGLLIASIVGMIVNVDFSWVLLVMGIAGSLWPDIDFLLYVGNRYVRGLRPLVDRWSTNHRDLLHRPLVAAPTTAFLVWMFFGYQEAIVFGFVTTAHFIHDTIGHGWGIRFLWPIDNRFYCYRSVGQYAYAFYRWTRAEQVKIIEQFGRDKWMQQSYGRISPELRNELLVLFIGFSASLAWYFA